MNKGYQLTSETTLTATYVRDINPFWENQVRKRTFVAKDGIYLFISSVIAPENKGTVVLSSGRTEGAIKYKELFYNLYQNGFSVFAIDHRGQGQSGRLTTNTDKGHVEDYQDYIDDFHQFYVEFVKPESSQKPLLLCHSMGCTVGAKYNLSFPEHFAKVIYSSPMFAIKAPIPVWLAKTIVSVDLSINRVFSDEPWYFFGQSNYQAETFADNEVTHSDIRFRLSNDDLDSVNAQLGGITSKWLSASIAAMDEIHHKAEHLVQPTLILQAGADTVVDNQALERTFKLIPDCQLQRVEGAKHELLLEKDKYRNQALQSILAFFQSK